mmetsp:Transcript_4589/g.15829  ORF Transcript_4589/g.15829 Transcript_4589/m.15829 type:complete len:222 (-) Transcript_4589:197-862(-)
MPPLQSPDRSRPGVVSDQSSAKPSSLCPVKLCRGAAALPDAAEAAAAAAAAEPPPPGPSPAPAVSATTVCSCGARSHTCTAPVSDHVATTFACCGMHRRRFTDPSCGMDCIVIFGPPAPSSMRPSSPSSSSSESSSESSSSSSSSSSLSSILLAAARSRDFLPPIPPSRASLMRHSWFAEALSACVPATIKSVCGSAVRASPRSSRITSKLKHGHSRRNAW